MNFHVKHSGEGNNARLFVLSARTLGELLGVCVMATGTAAHLFCACLWGARSQPHSELDLQPRETAASPLPGCWIGLLSRQRLSSGT